MLWLVGAGCIFLTIASVGLSFVANFSSGSGQSADPDEEYQLSISEQNSQIVRLQHEHQEVLDKLNAAMARKLAHDTAVETVSNLQDVVNELESENGDRLLKVSEVQDEIDRLGEDFQKYRRDARNLLWIKARNRELNQNQIIGGEAFINATITKVDETGLLVRHDAGVSHIPVERLNQELRNELDLDPEEARLAMLELYARDARGKASRRAAPAEDDTPVPTEAEIVDRRKELLAGMKLEATKLHRLSRESQAEANRSRSMDRYSSNRSVPASLETWAERAHRFDRLSLRYTTRLAAVLSKIREFDPAFEVR